MMFVWAAHRMHIGAVYTAVQKSNTMNVNEWFLIKLYTLRKKTDETRYGFT